jgi:hypothetical protein
MVIAAFFVGVLAGGAITALFASAAQAQRAVELEQDWAEWKQRMQETWQSK